MRSRRLTSSRVGPYFYDIQYVEDLKDTADAVGVCQPDRLVIKLQKNMPDDRIRETMMHEHLHAAIHAAGYEFPDQDGEEKFCNGVSLVLTQILQDNHKMTRYIARMDEE